MNVTDTERLEFIIQTGCYLDDHMTQWVCVRVEGDAIWGSGKTPREAIDNAMRVQEEP